MNSWDTSKPSKVSKEIGQIVNMPKRVPPSIPQWSNFRLDTQKKLINTPIMSPVSIRKLRRVKSSNLSCHIVFLKIMTCWKIVADVVSLGISIFCLIIRLLSDNRMTGIVYSSIYIFLGLIDFIVCIIIFKKLFAYQIKR